MLQHEFEELIGREATEQEYIEANAMYMDAGDVDKFDFCAEWPILKHSKVAKALVDKICALRKWKHEGLPLKNHIDNGRMPLERWKEAVKAGSNDANYRREKGYTMTRDDFFVDGVQWADEHPRKGLVDLNELWKLAQ